ncbi:MAG: FAD-binding oxidoreductase [Cellvibrionaceae bacterium]|nr:FAD-binding oxidoreductase [Cellvibrionaceae bacterium]
MNLQSGKQGFYPRPYSRMPWTAPRISPGAAIRAVVGHRPYRAQGFRVERETYDSKTVVHNYGHGGGGISLGWGSSGLAVKQVNDLSPGKVAVLGSGIMGLCTARLLQDAGWQVCVYTRDSYQHSTSNVAGGQWSPASTHDPDLVNEGFLSSLDVAARISHHAYASLPAAKYGITWLENYQLQRQPFTDFKRPSYDDVFAYSASLKPGEHPFADTYVHRNVTMLINPGIMLRQLTTDLLVAGGTIKNRSFESLDEVLALPEHTVFNCTGLGAAKLFGDKQLVPVKGQLLFLPPDPAVDYMTVGPGPGLLYMFPRSDVTVLGGTYKKNDDSTHVETEENARIIASHAALFSGFTV